VKPNSKPKKQKGKTKKEIMGNFPHLLADWEELMEARREIPLVFAIEPEGREESLLAQFVSRQSAELQLLNKHFNPN
jgi:hypothetical protein